MNKIFRNILYTTLFGSLLTCAPTKQEIKTPSQIIRELERKVDDSFYQWDLREKKVKQEQIKPREKVIKIGKKNKQNHRPLVIGDITVKKNKSKPIVVANKKPRVTDSKSINESSYYPIIENFCNTHHIAVLDKYDCSSLLKSIIKNESSWNRKAVSYTGAAGLMQLIHSTAKMYNLHVPNYGKITVKACYYEYELGDKIKREIISGTKSERISRCNSCMNSKGERPYLKNCNYKTDERFNAKKNIAAGANYFLVLLDQFDGNLEFTAAAYNWGEKKISRNCPSAYKKHKLKACNGHVPPQTKDFVNDVLDYYYLYSSKGNSISYKK